MNATCECGNQFHRAEWQVKQNRGKYCSKECKYKYRKMPKRGAGSYKLIKQNPTSFKKGLMPWNKGKIGVMPVPHNFKGDNVGYDALHDWVRKLLGKAATCEYCGSVKFVQWANKSHEYKRIADDWLSLCRKCHVKYDLENNAWGVATRKFNLTNRNKCRQKKQPSA